MLLTSLFQDLLLYVPGCPEPLAQYALVEAARKFCRDTFVITSVTDPITTTAGSNTLDLTQFSDGQTEIIGIIDVTSNELEIDTKSFDWLKRRFPWWQDISNAPPALVVGTSENQAFLWPTPDDSYTLQLTVATAPVQTALTIADDLGNRWKEAVLGYAMFRLCSQKGQAYTDPQMATLGLQMYSSDRNKARIEKNRAFGRSTQVTLRGFQ